MPGLGGGWLYEPSCAMSDGGRLRTLARRSCGTAVRVAPDDDYRRLAQSLCDVREATGQEEVAFEDLSAARA